MERVEARTELIVPVYLHNLCGIPLCNLHQRVLIRETVYGLRTKCLYVVHLERARLPAVLGDCSTRYKASTCLYLHV